MNRPKLKRLISFFCFDLPTNYCFITANFNQTHTYQKKAHSNWPTSATRCQLINRYWGYANWHYLFLIILSFIIRSFWTNQFNSLYIFITVGVGIISYLPLHYICTVLFLQGAFYHYQKQLSLFTKTVNAHGKKSASRTNYQTGRSC